jgi:small subunit ribosomal protein S17e
MGRVRTKTVKRASRAIIEKYYGKLTKDFHFNKRIIDDITVIQSKRMRNKIAGFTTHLMKRIEKGPVRGISLKLQEEERERKMDFIPEKSAIQLSNIDFRNPIVNRMIKELDIQSIIKEHRPARK